VPLTLLSPTSRSSKQEINKETSELSKTTDEMDFVNIYRIFQPTVIENTFFSEAPGIFSKIDPVLEYKASLTNARKLK
jgi:hypothetical protein